MTWLAFIVAISTLFGWVPWPAELVPAATWIAWAAIVCGVIDAVVSGLIRVIER